MNRKDKYELVIGLEIHAQLNTQSKIFCGDSAQYGAGANTQVSVVSLAHPGTLPCLNRQAVEHAVKLGLALNCDINRNNFFARKNYFYPDLPKGYQLTQDTEPICKGGFVRIQSGSTERQIRLNRIHLEEDAGKSIHDADPDYTCLDLNRAGVPLVEIVSEPDMHTAEDAYAYINELRKIVRWINVCDGNMEEGSMRCDANVSIRLKDNTTLGTRVEIKNLNSIRNVKKAIEIEFERLVELMENNIKIQQETRSFDADNNCTFSLRSKEEADDYRYFPDPDLPPLRLSEKFIRDVAESMPPLPHVLKCKFLQEYQLNEYDTQVLLTDRETSSFFESIILYSKNYKAIANWITGPVKYFLNENNLTIDNFPVSPDKLAELIEITEDGKINFTNASLKVLPALIKEPEKSPLEIASEMNLLQESDTKEIEKWISQVINLLPEKVAEYKKGKRSLQGLFAGEVKKLSKGKADMKIVNQLLMQILNK